MLCFHKLPFIDFFSLRTQNVMGNSGDFFELQEYVYGQDARFISPLASLKYNQLMTKVFQKEMLSYLHIFLLPSKSLLLGTPTKLSCISDICSILLHSAKICALKPVLHILDSQHIQTLSTHTDIQQILQHFKKLEFAQRHSLHKLQSQQIFNFIATQRHKKGIGIILGDFYKIESTPKITFLKNHLVLYALCVRPQEEYELKFLESPAIYVSDIEDGQICKNTTTPKMYKQRLTAYDTKLRAYCSRMGIAFSFINPKDSLLPQLQRAFAYTR